MFLQVVDLIFCRLMRKSWILLRIEIFGFPEFLFSYKWLGRNAVLREAVSLFLPSTNGEEDLSLRKRHNESKAHLNLEFRGTLR